MISVDKLYQENAPYLTVQETFPSPVEPVNEQEGALWTQDDLDFSSPWEIDAKIFLTESNDLLLIGTLDYEVTRQCARCLRPVTLDKTLQLGIVYQNTQFRSKPEDHPVEEGSFEGLQEWSSIIDIYPSGILPLFLQKHPEYIKDDYPTYTWFEHDLDILPSLREQVLLQQEPRVICEADCPGLCPNCGRRLDDPECHCDLSEEADSPEEDDGNYPFAGLADMIKEHQAAQEEEAESEDE